MAFYAWVGFKVPARLFLILASLGLLSLQSPAEAQSGPQSITFAQLTDAHIYDDGWKQTPPDALAQTIEALQQTANDRAALHWAINRINQLVASGTKIDFVVYTGDLGLQNVDFPEGNGFGEKRCQPEKARIEPGPPMVPLRWAVNEIATAFNQLVVRKIFFVAGNNDLIDESIGDTQRFNCFFDDLSAAVAKFSVPLDIRRLEADSVVDLNGIRLAGLNTASFKKLVNYNGPCLAATPSDATLRESCPSSQMELLHRVNAGRPLLLFTHVPDLKDPYRKTVSWEIQPKVRHLWEQQICAPNIIAVFAGHFHDSNRAIYGSPGGVRDLAVTECVAAKTWVAPPLAIKNQADKSPQARGFLLATVASTGVLHVDPIWYEPVTALSPSMDDTTSRWTRIAFVIAGFLVAAGLLLLIAKLAPFQKYRDLTASIVVVLFLGLAVTGIWVTKTQLGITDSATLIALLIIPLLLYGIASGRLTEFSGPGGWGAKFARQTVDLSQVPVDLKNDQQIETIRKENYRVLQDQIRQGNIHEGPPIILTMTMGAETYNAMSLNDYLRDLSHFPNFKFVIIVDKNDRLVAYVPARVLKRANDLNLSDFPTLITAVNNNNPMALLKVAGVLTEPITTRTTNAEALRTMEKYDLDAIPAVAENTRTVQAIVERNRILNRMLLALTGGDKT